MSVEIKEVRLRKMRKRSQIIPLPWLNAGLLKSGSIAIWVGYCSVVEGSGGATVLSIVGYLA